MGDILQRSILAAFAILCVMLGADSIAEARSGVVNYSASISFDESEEQTPAICTQGYSSQCGDMSETNCDCFLFSRASGSGSTIGKISNASLDISVNLDNANQTSNGFCAPSWGDLMVTGSKDTEELQIPGTMCFPDGAFGGKFVFVGGFQLAAPTNSLTSVFGTSVSVASPKYLLKLKGRACKIGSSCK